MISSENKYVQCCNTLYERVFIKKDKPKGFFKGRDWEKELYTLRNEVADGLKISDLDYDGIREYVKFIMYLEKVFLYRNDPRENHVVVSSETDSQKQVLTIVSEPQEDITQSPFNVEITTHYDYKKMQDVVEIIIARNTNRKIRSKFTVIDRQTTMDNPFDKEAVIIMNQLVRDYLYDLFMEYTDMIINGTILDFKNRSRYGEIDYPPI